MGHTDQPMDIATTKLNRSWGRFSENHILDTFTPLKKKHNFFNSPLSQRSMNPRPNINSYYVCIEDGGGNGGKSGFR